MITINSECYYHFNQTKKVYIMNIKKVYVELINFLEANESKKVSTILDEVRSMCESKTMSTTFVKNEQDEVIAIHCWYFKKWMPVSMVPFGKKANTATGLNTMCQEGVSLWTKQQRDATKANEAMLPLLQSGEMQVSDIAEYQAKIQTERVRILPSQDDTYHFETLEECLEFINQQ